MFAGRQGYELRFFQPTNRLFYEAPLTRKKSFERQNDEQQDKHCAIVFWEHENNPQKHKMSI